MARKAGWRFEESIMQDLKKRAVVSVIGDDEISKAVADGIISAKLSAKAKDIEKSINDSNEVAEFWREVAMMRTSSLHKATLKHLDEMQKSSERETKSLKAGVLIGFAGALLLGALVIAFVSY